MQNLQQSQYQYNTTQQNYVPPIQATPQQTRSGRISRPPVAQMGQHQLLGILSLLAQPGMEPVRAALEQAGLFDGLGQHQHRQEQQEEDRPVVQQIRGGRKGNSDGGSQAVSTTNSDTAQKGAKRSRPTDQSQPSSSRTQSQSNGDRDAASPDPTAWPAPPRGKGSRSAMAKEEILERRKERNKASAMASRQRKQDALEVANAEVRVKEKEVEELTARCERLEKE